MNVVLNGRCLYCNHLPHSGDCPDSAYDKPLPPRWALDEAARRSGFKNWFVVPSALRDPTNREVIVNARIIAKQGEEAS